MVNMMIQTLFGVSLLITTTDFAVGKPAKPTCLVDNDCSSLDSVHGYFCFQPVIGKCETTEEAGGGNCEQLGLYCHQNYDPVCGCDGKTYANNCMAMSVGGVSVSSIGPCVEIDHVKQQNTVVVETKPQYVVCQEDQHCSGIKSEFGTFCHQPKIGVCRTTEDVGSGICKEFGGMCQMIYKPVCGCDGKTYSNACVAVSEGASVLREGRCTGVATNLRQD